ncbi:hypothetical protein BJV77DRAFT_1073864 [Russula vinacea]|nr:hypothetical protein BJV77DRAFT_1073864 [Russula vinacea]
MECKAKMLQLLTTHKMEALADLLTADAYDHILNGIAWSSHLNLPTTDEEAYKAYREVTRTPPTEPKVRYTLRHTSLPILTLVTFGLTAYSKSAIIASGQSRSAATVATSLGTSAPTAPLSITDSKSVFFSLIGTVSALL